MNGHIIVIICREKQTVLSCDIDRRFQSSPHQFHLQFTVSRRCPTWLPWTRVASQTWYCWHVSVWWSATQQTWSGESVLHFLCAYRTNTFKIFNLQQIIRESGTLSHNFGFRSVHHHRHHQSHHQEVTTFQNGWVTVDYIFYSTLPSRHRQSHSADGRKEGKLKLLGRLSLPSAQQMALVGGLPNEHNPSDHLPLLADFLLSL